MAKRKSNFSEGKQNIIKALLDEYDIQSAFPKTEYQRCIVHQVRNTLKYVADKDKKKFAEDLKTIYQAPTEIFSFLFYGGQTKIAH